MFDLKCIEGMIPLQAASKSMWVNTCCYIEEMP